MNLLRNSQISLDEWTELISKSKFSSAFQTPAFYQIANNVPGMSAEVFAIQESEDLKAVCLVILQKESGIKTYFSRRAIIYGGPVIGENTNISVFESMLYNIANEFNKRSIYIEIRNLNDYSSFKEVFIRNHWQYIPYLNFIVDCSDMETLNSNLGNNRRRQIKKALANGAIIKEGDNIRQIDEFYSILSVLYSKKIKKPLPHKIFFEEIFKNGFGKFLYVMFNDKIIGGIVCPIFEKSVIYEFYVAGLDEEFREQSPSTLATWAAIEYANRNHIHFFDFMGAGRKDMDYGVREFKSRFGGKLVENGRYTKINNFLLYNTGRMALNIKQKIF